MRRTHARVFGLSDAERQFGVWLSDPSTLYQWASWTCYCEEKTAAVVDFLLPWRTRGESLMQLAVTWFWSSGYCYRCRLTFLFRIPDNMAAAVLVTDELRQKSFSL